MQNVTTLDETQQSIEKNAMVLIYFSGRSCGVCIALKPKIEEMLLAYPKIKSIHVDAEKSQDIAAYYNFFTIPAVLVFVEGKMTIREARCFSVPELNEGISRYYNLFFGEQVSEMNQSAKVMEAMINYFEGDIRRINHLIKVYGLAKTIGGLEGVDQKTQEILELAAITHDIGIKISEEKHNSSSGHYQQLEGPGEAKILLEGLGIEAAVIERVCWLIAHHHTYQNIDTEDHQILVEADFLVNAWEDEMDHKAVENVKTRIFRTKTGISILDSMYTR